MQLGRDERGEIMDLDEFLIDKPEATYMVRVKGDSMKRAGILRGDILLVERGRRPRVGDIVRRHAEVVEEYSIDECFAQLESSDPKILSKIKNELQTELGMTFSPGLAETKVLAKLASSKNKPDGFTILRRREVKKFLNDIDIGKVWGIGPATAGELRRWGIKTALYRSRPLRSGTNLMEIRYTRSPPAGERAKNRSKVRAPLTRPRLIGNSSSPNYLRT